MCIAIGLGIAIIVGFGAYQWRKRKTSAPLIGVEGGPAGATERNRK